jgi:hypothetical protein
MLSMGALIKDKMDFNEPVCTVRQHQHCLGAIANHDQGCQGLSWRSIAEQGQPGCHQELDCCPKSKPVCVLILARTYPVCCDLASGRGCPRLEVADAMRRHQPQNRGDRRDISSGMSHKPGCTWG